MYEPVEFRKGAFRFAEAILLDLLLKNLIIEN